VEPDQALIARRDQQKTALRRFFYLHSQEQSIAKSFFVIISAVNIFLLVVQLIKNCSKGNQK
jgi:uncharacterized membrane protein YidH (DUF202 family)